MMSVLNHADMSEMQITRTHIEWVRGLINQRSLRCRPRHDNPVPASDLCFQKSIAENRHDRDRIEDEDEQHHRGSHGGINPVVRDGYHDFQANPVQQRRYPVELRIPWPPKPIGSTRRWRACLICLFDVIKILHLQSLSIWKNSTGASDWKPIRPDHRGPIAHGHRKTPARSLPPPSIELCFTVLTNGRTSKPGHGRNEEKTAQSRCTSQSFYRSGCRHPATCAPPVPSDRART